MIQTGCMHTENDFSLRMQMQALYDLFQTSTGIQTDSRQVKPGELFFALRGEHFDGNQYAAQALAAGALACIVDDTSCP